MNKDENKMIKDIMAVIVRHHSGLGCDVLCDGDQCENCYLTAKDLYYEGYRKVAEDEIVIKKSEYEELTKTYAAINDEAYYCGFSAGVEEAKQETRDILQELYDEAMRYTNEVVELSTLQIKQLAKEKGIELEKDNGQRRNI